ncbi:arginine N-succinyltransferase [Pantoea sp. Aalb]|uniref:arginine N-succinyltransferase n=1 Tax=Pantoea sp. Aalb TaxID=2576762 RepID=UPI001329AE2A|nr:arginine N-succinyltransferase [Pantoea sp. Aalb]MXP68004.1 arginine N-succinyltransferase [Pantoea sp. Aalb]
MLFRPVQERDLSDIIDLAARAGIGLTSLPYNVSYLKTKINNSIASFSGNLPRSQQRFLFVLEDLLIKRVVGVSAIEAAVGLDEPFYNFRIQRIVRASRQLNVYKNIELLTLNYDQTGHSELCTLFLDPRYQKNRNGLLLSKARFLFIAAHPHIFSSHIFAEMRGIIDNQGRSPFWDALGYHFFDIPFAEADKLTGIGMKTFIAELMPLYPIYVSLLPILAQQAIGKVHPHTVPARSILEKEGFSWNGTIDIFDAGPVLEAETNMIRTIRDSQIVTVNKIYNILNSINIPCISIVSNDRFKDFSAILLKTEDNKSMIKLNDIQRKYLRVNENDKIRVITLYP